MFLPLCITAASFDNHRSSAGVSFSLNLPKTCRPIGLLSSLIFNLPRPVRMSSCLSTIHNKLQPLFHVHTHNLVAMFSSQAHKFSPPAACS